MTGFGRGLAPPAVVVEVRSVNHRHLEVSVRLPREYAPLEAPMRAAVRQRLARGHVDVQLTVSAPADGGRSPLVDTHLAAQYHRLLQDLAQRLQIPYAAEARALLDLPGVLSVSDPMPDAASAWPGVESALVGALDALVFMRSQEGAALSAALRRSLDALAVFLEAVEQAQPGGTAEQRRRLEQRLASVGVTPQSLPPGEVAALLERLDISEELARVRSHLVQLAFCLQASEPVGRRMDFLAQELQREWTTIAAKAADETVAQAAVSARVAVEAIREQVQNVE